MDTLRGKVQDIAGTRDALFAFDQETDPASHHQRHLFVRVRVLRRNQKRCETKPADHHLFTDKHLPFDALSRMFNRYGGPIQMLRSLQVSKVIYICLGCGHNRLLKKAA